EEAYFANVYKAGENENLEAVSFYATGDRTSYAVYVVTDFNDKEDLKNRTLVASGEIEYAGYYTINLNEPVELPDNKKFAVIVHINTPGAELPIAIEYYADEMTESFDITDGEGYISLYGSTWYSAEEDRNCNVCLKAFTSKR
ncbi:MAG: lectin like domain-containing protein, partial [Coprococcus sp.]